MNEVGKHTTYGEDLFNAYWSKNA